mgnify:CR=1 FL=1
MSKSLDSYLASDSDAFKDQIHLGENGQWKPIYPNEVGRALEHVEADYNYKVLTGTIANYRIYPNGQTPSSHSDVEDFGSDVDKVLTLKKEGDDFYWTTMTPSTGGTGTSLWTDSGSDLYYITGNVGIGTSTPSNKLHVQGSTKVTSDIWLGGKIHLPLVDNTQPGVTGLSDTNTMHTAIFMDMDGDDSYLEYGHVDAGQTYTQFRIVDNSVGDRFRIYVDDWQGQSYDRIPLDVRGDRVLLSQDGGNVGIGTTDPEELLHLVGSYPQIKLEDGDPNSGPTTTIGVGSGYTVFDTQGTSGGLFEFLSNGNSKLKIMGDGAIRFNHGGDSYEFPLARGNANQILKLDGSGQLSWADDNVGGGTSSLWSQSGSDIDYSSGNVGIDVAAPTALLHVGTPGSTAAIKVGRAGGEPSIKSTADHLIIDSNSEYVSLNHYVTDDVILANGGGNVGIGTTSPSFKLHLSTEAGNMDSKIESNNGHARLIIDSKSDDDAILQFNENNVRKWSIYVDGSDDNFKITRSDVPSGSTTDAISIDTSDNVSIPNGSFTINDYTFPESDGSEDQVLKTDGDGQLSWADQSNGGSQFSQWNDVNGHIIPNLNGDGEWAFDIGSAENKVRHIFVSDNSFWIGDSHKLGIDSSSGEVVINKIDETTVPLPLKDLGANETSIIEWCENNQSGSFSSFADVKTRHLINFAESVYPRVDDKDWDVSNIFSAADYLTPIKLGGSEARPKSTLTGGGSKNLLVNQLNIITNADSLNLPNSPKINDTIQIKNLADKVVTLVASSSKKIDGLTSGVDLEHREMMGLQYLDVGGELMWIVTKSFKVSGGVGKSAYQTWTEQPGNSGKTEAEFYTSLKGSDGTPGANGLSAMDLYNQAQSPENQVVDATGFASAIKGKDGNHGTNGTPGVDGLSALDLYRQQDGVDPAATFDDMKNSLKGADGTPGVDGLSAMDLYNQAQSPENQVADAIGFASAIKGKDGNHGTNGTNGTHGVDGDSALDVYNTANGTDLNTQQFALAIKGDDGDDGKDGISITGVTYDHDSGVWRFARSSGGAVQFTHQIGGNSEDAPPDHG